jgi:tetratricopeptide (TPR) repeat protein
MQLGARAISIVLQAAMVMLVVATLGVVQAPAQTFPDAAARAQKLDELFSRLKAAKDEGEGDVIVAEIWKVWQSSGRPELDEAMDKAIRSMAFGLQPVALGLLDDLVARAPDWAEAWNKRATVLFLLDELDRSLADIERVLALEPRHFGALAGRGLIYMRKEQNREALVAFRQALAVNPFLKERFELIPSLEKKLGEKPI